MQIPADKDYLIKRETLDNIAAAIRDKKGTTERFKAEDMASEIASISSEAQVMGLARKSYTTSMIEFYCIYKPKLIVLYYKSSPIASATLSYVVYYLTSNGSYSKLNEVSGTTRTLYVGMTFSESANTLTFRSSSNQTNFTSYHACYIAY